VNEDQAGLFEVDELAALPNAGRAEAGLVAALRSAEAARIVGPADAALAAAALVTARALDRAEALPDKTAVYAIAQLLPPFQKALHGLRLPAEVTPVQEGPAVGPADEGAGVASWLGDALGPR
jgi:hypothetical protein